MITNQAKEQIMYTLLATVEKDWGTIYTERSKRFDLVVQQSKHSDNHLDLIVVLPDPAHEARMVPARYTLPFKRVVQTYRKEYKDLILEDREIAFIAASLYGLKLMGTDITKAKPLGGSTKSPLSRFPFSKTWYEIADHFAINKTWAAFCTHPMAVREFLIAVKGHLGRHAGCPLCKRVGTLTLDIPQAHLTCDQCLGSIHLEWCGPKLQWCKPAAIPPHIREEE